MKKKGNEGDDGISNPESSFQMTQIPKPEKKTKKLPFSSKLFAERLAKNDI